MISFSQQRRLDASPCWPFRLNTSSPQAEGLLVWYSGLVDSGSIAIDLRGTNKGDASVAPIQFREGYKGFAVAAGLDKVQFAAPISITPEFAFAITLISNGFGAGSNPGFWRSGAAATGTSFNIARTASSQTPWIRMNGVDVLMPTSGTVIPSSGLNRMIYNAKSGQSSWWLNGVKAHTSATTYTAPVDTVPWVGYHSVTGLEMLGWYIDIRFYNRIIPDDLAFDMTGNPSKWWDLYAPRRTFVTVPSVVGATGAIKVGSSGIGACFVGASSITKVYEGSNLIVDFA